MTRVPLLPVLLAALASGGCMSWTPGWERPMPPPTGGDAPALFAQASDAFARAASRPALERAARLFEAAAAADPAHTEALSRACESWCLLGAGYGSSRADKRAAYRSAIALCERAMATNSDFAARVARGEPVDQAAAVLGEREMRAMHFWVTAVSYRFKETLSPLAYPFNLRWIERERAVMQRMEQLDPEWGRGALRFSWGIFYLALPARFGGDMARSRTVLDQLVADYPKRMLPRWGRAKYFYPRTGEEEARRRDLEWVAAREPSPEPDEYAWEVYFRTDARRLLAR